MLGRLLHQAHADALGRGTRRPAARSPGWRSRSARRARCPTRSACAAPIPDDQCFIDTAVSRRTPADHRDHALRRLARRARAFGVAVVTPEGWAAAQASSALAPSASPAMTASTAARALPVCRPGPPASATLREWLASPALGRCTTAASARWMRWRPRRCRRTPDAGRASRAVARLAMALAPHPRRIHMLAGQRQQRRRRLGSAAHLHRAGRGVRSACDRPRQRRQPRQARRRMPPPRAGRPRLDGVVSSPGWRRRR